MSSGWESSYIGIPYQNRGRDREGIDCYGLVVLVFREVFGVRLTSFDDFDIESPDIHQVWDDSRRSEWVRVADEDVRPGDVVDAILMRIPHCGIVVDTNRMIHSRVGVGVLIENFSRGYFCRRIRGIYRHRDMVS
ncbi:MAG: hypothetical protein CL793_07780 [Chloroflexi bacterium]|nr:hypothetical protein [Chloroflexota bacterium]|tara:strand:+ start:8060 stop:8464 length:405 start_codon:yes stop_codon:yes gene_type:complete